MLLKKRYRPIVLKILFPLAQLAFVAAILLGRLENSGLDFLIGALLGFSIAGNVAYLIDKRKNKR